MCSENLNDIPIRTLVSRSGEGWEAHCLDFNLRVQGDSPEAAVDRLEVALEAHLCAAREGRVKLFQSCEQELWLRYCQAAEAKLLASGPGHGHLEHRPLLAQLKPGAAAASI